MELCQATQGELELRAGGYSLVVQAEGPWLQLRWGGGGRVRLGAGAGSARGPWALCWSEGAAPQITLAAADGRRTRLECHEDRLYAWAELPEAGRAPALLAPPDTPSFSRLFSPEPTALRKSYFGPGERAVAAIGSDPSFHGGHWFFSPPPFCFVLQEEVGALVVGVAGRPEEMDLSAFEYEGAFSLNYDHAPIGPYVSPRLLLLPTNADPYSAVGRYCEELHRAGLAPRGTGRSAPAWWSSPGFCGWGEQSYRGCRPGEHVPGCLPEGTAARCSQRLYQDSLARLEAEGLEPGLVTIDDKWQRSYGLARPDVDRWPDMAGFIAAQHARGRRVLLWWKLWDGEGIPAEELLSGGAQPVVDPTSTAYRARLAGEVRHALLEMGADGFKVDFLHRGPTASHGPSRGGIAGLRLMRAMLEALRGPALEAREDCLLVAQVANPYLADLVDAVRLNDVSTPPGARSFVGEMRHRARVARVACPEALIDTDNWPCPDRAQWAEYVAAQPEMGVPVLYYATGVDLSGEPLRSEDYTLLRDCWQSYRGRATAADAPGVVDRTIRG